MRLLLNLLLIGGLIVLIVVSERFLDGSDTSTIDQLSGRAKIIDGDSLELRGERIRLRGIDAPEGRQNCLDKRGKKWPCGHRATMKLRSTIGRTAIRCEGGEYDRHQRLLATCYSGNLNLNRWMVENGWAVAYGKYNDAQEGARRKARGIWQGTFELPYHWRQNNRRN